MNYCEYNLEPENGMKDSEKLLPESSKIILLKKYHSV